MLHGGMAANTAAKQFSVVATRVRFQESSKLIKLETARVPAEPRKALSNDGRYLVFMSWGNRFITASTLVEQLHDASGIVRTRFGTSFITEVCKTDVHTRALNSRRTMHLTI